MPIEVPVPSQASTPPAFRLRGAAPAPRVHPLGTRDFLYYDAVASALRRTASFWGAILPSGTRWQVGSVLAVSVDAGASYPTDACLLNDIQPAISTAGGGAYLAYLEAAAAKGLLDDTSPCHTARRDFLKLRAKTMQKMAGFPAAIGRATANAPGAAGFLATLQN